MVLRWHWGNIGFVCMVIDVIYLGFFNDGLSGADFEGIVGERVTMLGEGEAGAEVGELMAKGENEVVFCGKFAQVLFFHVGDGLLQV